MTFWFVPNQLSIPPPKPDMVVIAVTAKIETHQSGHHFCSLSTRDATDASDYAGDGGNFLADRLNGEWRLGVGAQCE